jgi:hypothetical protein
MTKRTSNALALMVLSLVLFQAYRLAPLLPGDVLKGIVAVACTVGGAVCLIIGALRLVRDRG